MGILFKGLLEQQKGKGYALTGRDSPTMQNTMQNIDVAEFNTESNPIKGKLFFVTNGFTWWKTNVVEEIIEESETKIVFKTISGNVYTWKKK